MTEKRYNVWDIDGTIFLEDHKEGSYHIGQVGNVDINCLNDIANRLNDLTDENKQLKKDCTVLIYHNQEYRKENEQLKRQVKEYSMRNTVNSDLYDETYEQLKKMEKNYKSLLNENEQLKKQLSSINRLIDNKIDEFKNGDYGDLPCNTIHMFLDLKQELGDD